MNRELSIKKPAENKSKEGDKPSSKKGEVRKHTIKIKKSTLHQTSGSKVPSPHNAKEPAEQSKQALLLEAHGKQRHDEKTDISPPAKHEAAKQTKPTLHSEGGKQTAKYATTKTSQGSSSRSWHRMHKGIKNKLVGRKQSCLKNNNYPDCQTSIRAEETKSQGLR